MASLQKLRQNVYVFLPSPGQILDLNAYINWPLIDIFGYGCKTIPVYMVLNKRKMEALDSSHILSIVCHFQTWMAKARHLEEGFMRMLDSYCSVIGGR